MCIAAWLLAAAAVRAGEASGERGEIAALRAEIAALKQQLAEATRAAEPPELGAQMLELQIRHARLWFAGDAGNWTLAAFQLHELRESLAGVVASNPEHAALQPQRLAEVLPAIMDPPAKRLQAAIDARDRRAFARAYDGLTEACNACHDAAGFGFNRFQRPRTPVLDNQRYAPSDR
jgi:hypothetical protein